MLEAAVRIFLPPPQIVSVTNQTLFLKTKDGLRLRPDIQAVIYNHRLSHLDVEMRKNPLVFKTPPLGIKNKPRILFTGDSITFADYVAEKDSFVRRIEVILKEKGRD